MSLPKQNLRSHYIVRSSDVAELAKFIERVIKDTDIELVDIIGPPDAPHTVVVAMMNETAVALESEFSRRNILAIEQDQPLVPLVDGQKDA